MREISVYDDPIFSLLEELYNSNHKDWKRRILRMMSSREKKDYKQIKEQLPDVIDLLAYRCIQELVSDQILKPIKEEKYTFYALENENMYIRGILEELELV